MIPFTTIKEAGERHAKLLKDTIINNKQSATGRTVAAIRSEPDEKGYTIFAPGHIKALQYGRRPTSKSGNGDLYFKILEWVKAKGVVFNDNVRNSKYTIEERTAKTITFFIHKQGTYLFKYGRTFDGVSNPILPVFSREAIMKIANEAIQEGFVSFSSELFDILGDIQIKKT